MGQPYRILSLDGGGIRGVIEAAFLRELESDLETDQKTLYDSFDLIAGTSTGGLIAILIAAKQSTGEDLLELYSPHNAQRIMNKSFFDTITPIQGEPKYDGKGKTEVLEEEFQNLRINDVEKSMLIVAYDIVLRRVVVYKNFGGSDSASNPTLVEIADATSAAPTYFPTIESESDPSRWLVDGGLAANNPSMCALAEALRQGIALEDIRMLSIGTGIPTRHADNPDGLGRASQGWGGIGWLKNGLIEHLFAANASICEYQCGQLLGDHLVRVDGPLVGASDDLDEVSAGNIQNLQLLGQKWYFEQGAAAHHLLKD